MYLNPGIKSNLATNFPMLSFKQLAYAFFQKIMKQIDPVSDTQLSGLPKLENYLKNAQWGDADRETYYLMMTTLNKVPGGNNWLEPDELLNFPCSELRAIDALWVKYSNGRFGFSVQKQIYVECGGKLDGSDPDVKIWEEFCDRVGWRKNSEWVDYFSDYRSKLNFSNKPCGHLPRRFEFARVACGVPALQYMGLQERRLSLFAHMETCKL